MTESLIINIATMILFLPLLGFAVVLFFGKKYPKIYLFEVADMLLVLLLSIFVMIAKIGYFPGSIVYSFNWIDFGNVPFFGNTVIELGIEIDNVSAIMLVVVNLISFLVHMFSIGYMKGDSRYTRYFAYLGLFTFSMLGIVITHNLLMMYIFWELVGLSSYLLIGFWYEKKSASDAGKKAFLVNRVGDIGMFIGILILYANYHTFTFADIYAQMQSGILPFGSEAWLTAAGILIFMGAVGKSAQFPLHVWLPDAMEGPTPVSALIHAATMVAAGVYLLIKIFVMLTADAMLVIAVTGAVTSFVAATIALTQNDIKKVLAYSTVSQLGYMVMAVGSGAYLFAFFHLVTHAFFKACLFLGSGSVIHAMHHEQDIRAMGGLRKKMPLTYMTFLISTLAISGVPLTSGFLSKDGLLAGTLAFGNLTGHWLIPIFGFTVALMTAFYMFRLVIKTFHGKPRDMHKYEHAHESTFVMAMPLVVLSALSIFIWYTPNPISADAGWFASSWVQTPESVVPQDLRFEFMQTDTHETAAAEHHITHSEMYTEAMHSAHYPAMFLSLGLGGLGILLAFMMYQWKKINSWKLAMSMKPLYNFSLNKWYIDELYHATVIAGTLGLAKMLTWFDQKIIDGIVNGSAWLAKFVSKMSDLFDTFVVDGLVNFTAFFSGFIGLTFRRFQTGKVQTYLVFVIFSLIVLLVIFRPF
ncbi:MAG: NADH-quinone oxidoreductase subunit L [Melioribacteraceae bacterium]|nr:NADH-quinone oxidoreductase subunit L [Melioribacteraceae bacterium]MCF8355941.1 NADH-quinone oxidoreductase subunit L [Melioribacteraceae bacterium]MCF8395814.1 NADH-quinone oxidoreductase subunit L [Melioribacteraceae bacterium]MCF8420806.1 NADH-quinone oxidoreductase subunit L [Melioribacteraceae bacterium]